MNKERVGGFVLVGLGGDSYKNEVNWISLHRDVCVEVACTNWAHGFVDWERSGLSRPHCICDDPSHSSDVVCRGRMCVAWLRCSTFFRVAFARINMQHE